MIWRETLLLALREIRRNLLRSSLTALGIVIGVAAVIGIVTLGGGATRQITGDIASLGHNMLIVAPGNERGHGGRMEGAELFDVEDARAIERDVAGLGAVAATSSRPSVIVYGNQNWPTTVTGANNAYFEVRDWTVIEGRAFTAGEERAGKPVCVIGDRVREELYGAQISVGTSVRIGRISCRVIGVLEARGQSNFGMDQDDVVHMPVRTFHRRIAGNRDVATIFVSAERGDETPRIQRDIESLLRQRRKVGLTEEDDFQVRDISEISEVVQRTAGVLTGFLSLIAAISLLVGGIGIMNIMLVSVTERTREIGLRMAIGAMEREVRQQFLLEASLLAGIGGLAGVALGLIASALAAPRLGIPFLFDPEIVLIAFAFASAVGLVFGYFPARRAARLDPIDALRHE